MGKKFMNLEKAIEWAESQSSKHVDYHVKPWNDGYSIISDGTLKRHPDTVIIYNTKTKRVDSELIKILNCKFKNRHIKEEVLQRKLVKPTFVCVREYDGGPSKGELLTPYYETVHKCFYFFEDDKGATIRYDLNKIERMCCYIKEHDELAPPKKKNTRKNNLLKRKKK